jgi:hypothetical protein
MHCNNTEGDFIHRYSNISKRRTFAEKNYLHNVYDYRTDNLVRLFNCPLNYKFFKIILHNTTLYIQYSSSIQLKLFLKVDRNLFVPHFLFVQKFSLL